jgi:hypothetical protein
MFSKFTSTDTRIFSSSLSVLITSAWMRSRLWLSRRAKTNTSAIVNLSFFLLNMLPLCRCHYIIIIHDGALFRMAVLPRLSPWLASTPAPLVSAMETGSLGDLA